VETAKTMGEKIEIRRSRSRGAAFPPGFDHDEAMAEAVSGIDLIVGASTQAFAHSILILCMTNNRAAEQSRPDVGILEYE